MRPDPKWVAPHPGWADLVSAWLVCEDSFLPWEWPPALLSLLERECLEQRLEYGGQISALYQRADAEDHALRRMEAACAQAVPDLLPYVEELRAGWHERGLHRAHLADLWLSGWVPWAYRLARVRLTGPDLSRLILRQERRANPGPGCWPPPTAKEATP